MFEEWIATLDSGSEPVLAGSVERLLVAVVLGAAVAWVYRHGRRATDVSSTFPITLLLLTVLIALVTQIIGHNVARAFSLVGTLSIVRFRTVVRDTLDTAYVVFAVVIGMAVGSGNALTAAVGLAVIGVVLFVSRFRAQWRPDAQPVFILSLRMGLGFDPDLCLKKRFTDSLQARELIAVGSSKQGIALDFTYETRLKPGLAADEFVRELNRTEGVQSVAMERRNAHIPVN